VHRRQRHRRVTFFAAPQRVVIPPQVASTLCTEPAGALGEEVEGHRARSGLVRTSCPSALNWSRPRRGPPSAQRR